MALETRYAAPPIAMRYTALLSRIASIAATPRSALPIMPRCPSTLHLKQTILAGSLTCPWPFFLLNDLGLLLVVGDESKSTLVIGGFLHTQHIVKYGLPFMTLYQVFLQRSDLGLELF